MLIATIKKIGTINTIIIVIGILLHVLTAVYSIGYLHPDEHFQILEFANYKLGINRADELPWEFNAQIRATIQPSLTAAYLWACSVVGISNPFTQTLFLRLVSGITMVLLSSALVLRLFSKQQQPIALLFALGFAYIPFINVRFSSENLGLIFFILALLVFLNPKSHAKPSIFSIMGLFLGFSFYFRFQMAAAIAGLGLWLLFIHKLGLRSILFLSLGFGFALLYNTYCDYLFYGNWSFTPYAYFHANIVQNVAASFGTQPWDYYFHIFFLKSRPFSFIFIVLLLVGLMVKRKHVLVWTFIPFLLLHIITSHKELRFLFPIFLFFVLICLFGLFYLLQRFNIGKYQMHIALVLFACNIIYLLPSVFLPANSNLAAWKFCNQAQFQNHKLYTTDSANHHKWNLAFKFYNNYVSIPKHKLDTPINFNDLVKPALIISSKPLIYSNAKLLYSGYPSWLQWLNYKQWSYTYQGQYVYGVNK